MKKLSSIPAVMKNLRVMKLTPLLMLAVIMMITGKGWAQAKLTLTVKNERLGKVFDTVEKKTGYFFFFDEKILENARPVSINAVDMPLDQFLKAVLKDQSLRFSIRNKTITIALNAQPLINPTEQLSSAENNSGVHQPLSALKGKVTDVTGEPLAGATVTVSNTRRTTQCDSQGDFVLKIAGSNDREVTLTVSFIGYETQSRIVYSDGKITVFKMQPNNNALDEVQIVAYGTSTRRYDVGSVATVTSKEIERQPVNSPIEALEGRVAGLMVTARSGAPNSMVTAQIRGQNTLPRSFIGRATSLEDLNQPLFIIDGVPFAPQNTNVGGSTSTLSLSSNQYNIYGGISPLSSINPLDIESITVLKDADATAIYGSRGSNGVILINTKRAEPGKLSTVVSFSAGPSVAVRKVKMMDTRQYLSMRREAFKNDGLAPTIAPPYGNDYDLLLFDSSRNIDWYDRLLGGTAYRTDAHVTLSGGSNSVDYLIGGGYTKTGFNYPGDFANERYSLNSQIRMKSFNQKFKLSIGSLFTYQDNKNSNGLTSFGLINTPPNFPDFLDENGELLWFYKGVSFSRLSAGLNGNFYAGLHQPFRSETYNYAQSLNWSYTLFPGLIIGGVIGYNRFQAINYSATPIASRAPDFPPSASALFENITSATLNIEPQLNYSRIFGKFNLRVLVGATYQKNRNETELITASGYVNDALLNSTAGASFLTGTGSDVVDKYVAGFGRLTGIWDNRYILNLTGNINGSSLFGPGHRYGKFGSIGGGWIFSETKWIKKKFSILSYGKLTANFGVSGSNNIPAYLYQPNWQLGAYPTQYQGSGFYLPLNPFNPDFHWATKKDYNGHLSLGLLRDRLVIDAGVYLNRTGDQLLDAPVPVQTGFPSLAGNAPFILQNKGWEISLSSGRNLVAGRRKKFTWNVPVFNMSQNHNKIVRMPENSPYDGIFHTGYSSAVSPFLKYAGVDPQTGLFQYYKADGKTLTTSPDRLSAYNSMGDATELIDFSPSIMFGIGDGFSWNGLTINFFGQFVKQKGFNYLATVYDGALMFLAPGSAQYNVPSKLVGKEWQKPGDNAAIQRFGTASFTQDFAYSTGAVGNASYFRLTNMEIRYQLSTVVLHKLGLKAGSVKLMCENLFTITRYEVGDPVTQNIYNIPPQRAIIAGFNLSF